MAPYVFFSKQMPSDALFSSDDFARHASLGAAVEVIIVLGITYIASTTVMTTLIDLIVHKK